MSLIKLSQILERMDKAVAGMSAAIAMGCVVIMMLYVVADVFMRFAFNSPFKGSYEGTGFLMCFAFSYGIAWTQRQKGHVAVTFLVSKLSEKIRCGVETGIYSVYLLTIVVLIWRALVRASNVFVDGTLSLGEVAPFGKMTLGPFYYVVAIAFMPLALTVLSDLVNTLAKGDKK